MATIFITTNPYYKEAGEARFKDSEHPALSVSVLPDSSAVRRSFARHVGIEPTLPGFGGPCATVTLMAYTAI